MSYTVTCSICGRPVDDADCVELPVGLVCNEPCYVWLESMMDQADDDDSDNEGLTIVYIEVDE